MGKPTLTIRVELTCLEGTRRSAQQHGTTPTRLVPVLLGRLTSHSPAAESVSTPVLHRLTGVLPSAVSPDPYIADPIRKHGVQAANRGTLPPGAASTNQQPLFSRNGGAI